MLLNRLSATSGNCGMLDGLCPAFLQARGVRIIRARWREIFLSVDSATRCDNNLPRSRDRAWWDRMRLMLEFHPVSQGRKVIPAVHAACLRQQPCDRLSPPKD